MLLSISIRHRYPLWMPLECVPHACRIAQSGPRQMIGEKQFFCVCHPAQYLFPGLYCYFVIRITVVNPFGMRERENFRMYDISNMIQFLIIREYPDN